MWTIGVAIRWAANVYAWQWRLLLPLSGVLELAAFLIFFNAVSQHRPADSRKSRLEPWIWVVISVSPALSHILDQRYLVLIAWGFLVPFVWGFSAKWMTVFLGFKPFVLKVLLGARWATFGGGVLRVWAPCGVFVGSGLGCFPPRADRRIHRGDGLLRRAAHSACVRGDAA